MKPWFVLLLPLGVAGSAPAPTPAPAPVRQKPEPLVGKVREAAVDARPQLEKCSQFSRRVHEFIEARTDPAGEPLARPGDLSRALDLLESYPGQPEAVTRAIAWVVNAPERLRESPELAAAVFELPPCGIFTAYSLAQWSIKALEQGTSRPTSAVRSRLKRQLRRLIDDLTRSPGSSVGVGIAATLLIQSAERKLAPLGPEGRDQLERLHAEFREYREGTRQRQEPALGERPGEAPTPELARLVLDDLRWSHQAAARLRRLLW